MGAWDVAFKLFAHPPYNRFNIVGDIAGPLIFAANMFAFVTLVRRLTMSARFNKTPADTPACHTMQYHASRHCLLKCTLNSCTLSQLSLIVLEKELGLRQALRTMGMLDSTYWLSITVFEGLMVLIVSLLISVMGIICDFALFRDNAFVNYWGLFFTFGLAMTSFAMFLSVFLRRYAFMLS